MTRPCSRGSSAYAIELAFPESSPLKGRVRDPSHLPEAPCHTDPSPCSGTALRQSASAMSPWAVAQRERSDCSRARSVPASQAMTRPCSRGSSAYIRRRRSIRDRVTRTSPAPVSRLSWRLIAEMLRPSSRDNSVDDGVVARSGRRWSAGCRQPGARCRIPCDESCSEHRGRRLPRAYGPDPSQRPRTDVAIRSDASAQFEASRTQRLAAISPAMCDAAVRDHRAGLVRLPGVGRPGAPVEVWPAIEERNVPDLSGPSPSPSLISRR